MSIAKRKSFGRLTTETMIRGTRAAEWDAVFTGGLQETLRVQRAKVEQLRASGTLLDISSGRLDVASSVKRLKRA